MLAHSSLPLEGSKNVCVKTTTMSTEEHTQQLYNKL